MRRLLLFPVAWPISLLLDAVLGRDIGTVYSQKELERLIDLHYSDPDAQVSAPPQRLYAFSVCFLFFCFVVACANSGFSRLPHVISAGVPPPASRPPWA